MERKIVWAEAQIWVAWGKICASGTPNDFSRSSETPNTPTHFPDESKLRSKIAGKKKIPAYIVFGDGALRDMARKRPASLDTFLNVKGVGEKKYKKYGETFITAI